LLTEARDLPHCVVCAYFNFYFLGLLFLQSLEAYRTALIWAISPRTCVSLLARHASRHAVAFPPKAAAVYTPPLSLAELPLCFFWRTAVSASFFFLRTSSKTRVLLKKQFLTTHGWGPPHNFWTFKKFRGSGTKLWGQYNPFWALLK
jgi:hypothetical protein